MSDAERLDDAVRDALGLADDAELEAIAYDTTPEWDSVGHLQMMAAIEAAFDIRIDADDVVQMSDYDKVRSTLRSRYGVRC
jgi:acyl carrier protein